MISQKTKKKERNNKEESFSQLAANIEIVDSNEIDWGSTESSENKETEEDEGEGKGRLDIKVQYSRLHEFDPNDECYHTIECKRFGNDLSEMLL